MKHNPLFAKMLRAAALRSAVVLGPCALLSCAPYDLSKEMNGDFQAMVGTYQADVQKLAEADKNKSYNAGDLPQVPSDFTPTANNVMGESIRQGGHRSEHTLEDLYVRALKNSSQIKVFSDIPLIRETGIQEAQGAFDTHFFTEAKYDHVNDPVGSTLTTGGPPRFEEEKYSLESGLKKKVGTGAEVTLSQEISRTHNNSVFFIPESQGQARLKLTVVQPLLKGAGLAYNESVIQIAKLDSEIARSEFIRQAESHLLEITRTYWSLYLARGLYQEKKKLVDDTRGVVDEFEARKDIDTVRRQTLRSKAALAERNAELIRSEAAIRNTQDRLQTLVNDPTFTADSNLEIIPMDRPFVTPVNVDIKEAAYAALRQRPEINQGFLQLRAAAIREKMQRNEILPQLDFIVQGSLAGLADEGKVEAATDRQLSKGGPGYMLGMTLDVPLENNIAEARLTRRRLELRQQFQQLKTTIETVLLEVKVAVRELKTAYRDTQAKYDSMLASREDLDDLRARKELQIGSDDVPTSTYLDMLLSSQERKIGADDGFLRSLATYNTAIVTLERAKGNLLNYQSVKIVRTEDDDLPALHVRKTGKGPTAPIMKPTPIEPIASEPKAADVQPEPIKEVAPSPTPGPTAAPEAPAVEMGPPAVVPEPVTPPPAPPAPLVEEPKPAAVAPAPEPEGTWYGNAWRRVKNYFATPPPK